MINSSAEIFMRENYKIALTQLYLFGVFILVCVCMKNVKIFGNVHSCFHLKINYAQLLHECHRKRCGYSSYETRNIQI